MTEQLNQITEDLDAILRQSEKDMRLVSIILAAGVIGLAIVFAVTYMVI